MRRGFLLSFLIHLAVLAFLVLNVPDMIMPEQELTFINVKLVSSPDAAKTSKPRPIKAIKTQQSNAPKEPPKPKKKTPAPKHDTKLLNTPKSELKKQVKEVEKQPKQEEEASKTDDMRPPKLDKTPDKKNLVKEQGKPDQVVTEDDFLKALDFIDDLKNKKSALVQADETTETTVYDPDQKDIALIKSKIEQNWYRPPGIARLDKLKVMIMVKVNRDGTVSSMDVKESSGEAFFDNSILRAVRKSVPLPIPADKYDVFKTIQLTFNGG